MRNVEYEELRLPPARDPDPRAYYVPYRNGLATAALVMGIISIPLNFLLIPSVLAWIFGATAKGQVVEDIALGAAGHRAWKSANTGMYLGVAMTIITVILVVVFVITGTLSTMEQVNRINMMGVN